MWKALQPNIAVQRGLRNHNRKSVDWSKAGTGAQPQPKAKGGRQSNGLADDQSMLRTTHRLVLLLHATAQNPSASETTPMAKRTLLHPWVRFAIRGFIWRFYRNLTAEVHHVLRGWHAQNEVMGVVFRGVPCRPWREFTTPFASGSGTCHPPCPAWPGVTLGQCGYHQGATSCQAGRLAYRANRIDRYRAYALAPDRHARTEGQNAEHVGGIARA